MEAPVEDSFTPTQILLVEDNADDIEITQRAFTKSRVANELVVVRDGEEALELLFSRRSKGLARPDLVLLDVNLPKVTGIEVLEKIRATEELATMPVIMLTASDRNEDVMKSYELGANTYIQKPVEFSKFVRALEVLGEYWILVAKLPPKGGLGGDS